MDPYVAQTSEPNLLSPLKQKKTKWKVYRATRPTTKTHAGPLRREQSKGGDDATGIFFKSH
jgi:hypothetical protein